MQGEVCRKSITWGPRALLTISPLCPPVQRAVSLFSLNDPALSPDVPPAHSPVHSHLSLERGPPTPRTTPTMR